MGYGLAVIENKRVIKFGFEDIADWLDSVILSFPAPWTIGTDTNYGTEIIDSDGVKIMSTWMAFGDPSARERRGMSDAEWNKYCCDTHWESETQWYVANAIVSARNALIKEPDSGSERIKEILRDLVIKYGRWDEDIDLEISCGGPKSRLTSTEFYRLYPDRMPSQQYHSKVMNAVVRPKTS